VGQGEGFCKVFIETQDGASCPSDLRYLNRVREAVTEVIRKPGREDLRLVFKPSESARVYDAVAVSLKIVTVRMRRLGITPPPRGLYRKP